MALTARERMIAAYEGRPADTVPVAPEFWYYVPARLLGLSMIEFQQEIPHWQALLETFRHYQCEGWGIVAPTAPPDFGGARRSETRAIGSDQFEVRTTIEAEGRRLESRTVLDAHEPAWSTERPIKDFDADWPVYERMTLVPPQELDWRPVQEALDKVGEEYLLEVYVGCPFVDFAGGPREGGLEQVIFDLCDRETQMEALRDRYVENVVGKIREAFANTTARSIFVGSGWSSISLLSPAVWRRWERPVLEAAVRATHECGGIVHHHFHGRCMPVLGELADIGVDCICPFERPPGGDVTDLPLVRDTLGDQVTFNGNVHTVETLIRGAAQDVRDQVAEILDVFGDSPRLIVGTGDQVGVETPDENIHAMIDAARSYGKRTNSSVSAPRLSGLAAPGVDPAEEDTQV